MWFIFAFRERTLLCVPWRQSLPDASTVKPMPRHRLLLPPLSFSPSGCPLFLLYCRASCAAYTTLPMSFSDFPRIKRLDPFRSFTTSPLTYSWDGSSPLLPNNGRKDALSSSFSAASVCLCPLPFPLI